MNSEIAFLAISLCLFGMNHLAGGAKRLSLSEQIAAIRQSDELKKLQKGVRGECFETFLLLEDMAREDAKKTMREMDGWHELAMYDGKWRTVLDAVAQDEASIEQMLKVVKLEEKKKYVEDFENLDYVGKKELPCVKAIQESYASKYPVLLNSATKDVETTTESEIEAAKAEMNRMIIEYGKKLDKLTDDATKNSDIGPHMRAILAAPSDLQ